MKIGVIFCIFICTTNGYIWETGDSFENWLKYVPSVRETAQKLMTFFLERNGRLLKRDVHKYHRLPFDTVFIVDASRSLTKVDFNLGQSALKELILRSQSDSKFAGISFSNHANVTFSFVSAKEAIEGIDKMIYVGGKTNTQAALNKARRKLLFNKFSGLRMKSFKRIFLLTDGQSNVRQWETLYKALQIKMLGVEIFVMAVGDLSYGINELISIASSSDTHLFRVKNMEDFEKVVKLIPLLSTN